MEASMHRLPSCSDDDASATGLTSPRLRTRLPALWPSPTQLTLQSSTPNTTRAPSSSSLSKTMASKYDQGSKLEISQRVSHLSNLSQSKDIDLYDAVKTPELEIEGGALRAGGAPRLFSRDYIGMVAQYAAVGFIDSLLPNTLYPFMQMFLNISGAEYVTASTLLALPWSFKVFYGIVSDCFPIFGFRRRPYMIIGWSICFAMLLIMACMPVGKPYFPDPALREIKPDDLTEAQALSLNKSAQKSGGKYVLLMMFSGFGYIMADVSADGIMCELAQCEPIAIRGRTQSIIYATRTAFNMLATVFIAFAFNGVDYGGHFHFSLKFSEVMLILAIMLAPIIPITWFFIKEEKHAAPVFTTYMGELWEILQTRAVYQVIFYQFMWGIFNGFSYTAASLVQAYYAKVEPLNEKVGQIFGYLCFMAAITLTGKFGLHWNWRYVISVSSLLVIVLDSICSMLTVWDIVRNQWFWLGLPIAINVPQGVSFIISTFVTVELAREGNEGAMYGLLTTVSNLTIPFASTLTKIVDRAIGDFSNDRVQNDSHAVRLDITYSVLLMYGMTVIGWGWLYFLPKQKEETQELKRTGGSSRVLGAITLVYLVFSLVWSVATNLMGIFDSTSCLVIAGGDGC